jgi:accessory gene regulator B
MIVANKVAVIITDYLYKNKTIDENHKDVYIYGFEILISNVINFCLIMGLGIMFREFIHSFLFYVVFVVTRSFCGGYHAGSYLKCNVLFTVIYLTTLLFSKLMNPFMSLVYLFIFLAIYIGCVIEYAPIDSENKKLTKDNKQRFKSISILISLMWTGLIVILYLTAREYATTITLTLVMIALLMLVEVNKRRENY